MFENVTKEKLIEEFPYLKTCGRLRPSECTPRQKIAFIFPYRNRFRHLHITLYNLIPILKRQLADVTFFVVEQVKVFHSYLKQERSAIQLIMVSDLFGFLSFYNAYIRSIKYHLSATIFVYTISPTPIVASSWNFTQFFVVNIKTLINQKLTY